VLNGGDEIVIANSDGTVGGLMAYQQIDDNGASFSASFANESLCEQGWGRNRRQQRVGCLDLSLL
jgi:hypothetical protein